MDSDATFDWPGWSLADNPYGKDFDLAARKRMVAGSKNLVPLLTKYKEQMGKIILEVGPFFNPLINPRDYPDALIFYWENDHHVLKKLLTKPRTKNTYPIYCNLNTIEGDSLLKLKMEKKKHFEAHQLHSVYFDAVVVSHVLNYIDYKLFFMVLKEFLKKDGLIFINNVIDYGLPKLFSQKRPKSVEETITSIQETGYVVIEKKIISSPDRKYQKHDGLVLVVRNEVI